MRKAVYQNPKSGKLYAFLDNEEGGRPEILTVFDNAKTWDKADVKADKKGRAYRVLDLDVTTTKNGHKVFRTIG